MTRINLDSEDALEQATLALFRRLGWDTVNCMDEVFGDAPPSSRRPNLGRETTGEVVLPRLVSGEINVENIDIAVGVQAITQDAINV